MQNKVQAGFDDGTASNMITRFHGKLKGAGYDVIAKTQWGCSCCEPDMDLEGVAKALWIARLINGSGEAGPSESDMAEAKEKMHQHERHSDD